MHTTPHTHTHTHTTMCMQDGFFPLYIASQEGHERVVEMLLQAGGTVDLQSKVENLCSSVNCSVMYSNSLYTKYSTQYSRENKVQRANNQY